MPLAPSASCGGFERLEAMGDRAQLSLVATLLARAVEEQGRADEALELTLVGERFAVQEDVCAQVIWRTVRARALAASGSVAEAERLAREAVELAATTDWLVGRGDAAWTLGVVLLAGGADEAAYQAWSDALSFYEHKGAVLSVAFMRAAIDGRARSGALAPDEPAHDLRRYTRCPIPTSTRRSTSTRTATCTSVALGAIDSDVARVVISAYVSQAPAERYTGRARDADAEPPQGVSCAKQRQARGRRPQEGEAHRRSRGFSATVHDGPFRPGWAWAEAEAGRAREDGG